MAKKFVVIEEFPNYSINRDGVVINNKTKHIKSVFMYKKHKSISLRKNNNNHIRYIDSIISEVFPKKITKKKITVEQIMNNCTTKYTGAKAKKLLSNFFYGIGPKTQKELIRAINIAAN